jgi:hypothetical protein
VEGNLPGGLLLGMPGEWPRFLSLEMSVVTVNEEMIQLNSGTEKFRNLCLSNISTFLDSSAISKRQI